MTSPIGMYGGYKYESVEARSLGSITRDSYDYRDQGKLLSKLTGDVSYMAAYMRKMQKGIDDANQNFIQQIQSFINDIIVIFGGGGDTGLDFGDLKYILQAIGALFGFDTSSGLPLPVNLFQAAWHFFSNYIFPVENFHEVIDEIIDAAIATTLDLFGEVPILGQALQQLAVIISNIRDSLGPLTDALDRLFGAFDGDWQTGDFGAFTPLWDSVLAFFGVITGPILTALLPILEIIATWSVPFINALADVIDVITNVINAITGGLDFTNFTDENFNILTVVPTIIANFISNGLLGPNSFLNAFNLFGFLPPGLIPFLPVSHIGNDNPELLGQGAFGSADTIAPGGTGWVWDGTTGKGANGSVKATANGTARMLVSDPIYVSNTQKLDLSVWIKWASVAYTGNNHVQLFINSYSGPNHSDYISGTAISSQTFTGANQSTWQQLSGTHTVGTGVTYVRVALKVNSNITAGNIWFDDVSAKKSGQIQQSWISGLVEQFTGILNMFGLGALGDLIGINVTDVWSTIISDILNPLELIRDVLAQDYISEISNGMEAILRRVPFVGGVLASMWDALTDFVGFADATEATTVQTRESIVTNITGSPVTDPTNSDVDDAISGQTDAIVAAAAAAAALEQLQTGATNSGVSGTEPFEYVDLDSLSPTLWQRYVRLGTNGTNGTIAVADGHNAGMVAGTTSSDYEEANRYIGPNNKTLTKFQRIGIVIATPMTKPGFLDGRSSAIDIFGKWSDDDSKWVRFRWFVDGSVQFHYKNGGAVTALGGTTSGAGNPAAASALWVECGTTGGSNVYRLMSGTKVIKTVTDSGHVIDESQYGFGWGQFMDSNLLPGKITQFSWADNTPATILGSTFRAYRASTSGLSQPSGTQICASNTFDTVDYISSDLTWDPTTSKLTVTKSGTYLVSSRYCFTTVIGSNEEWDNAVFKNGTIYSYGNSYTGLQETSTSNDNENRLDAIGGGMMTVYLTAGQYLQFGYFLSGARSMKGDANGSISWVTATRVGS